MENDTSQEIEPLVYFRGGRRAKFKRWLFNLITAISLLLSIGVGVLWYRSYHRMDHANCILLGRYDADILAPTDGLVFSITDEGHPGSPSYRGPGMQTFDIHVNQFGIHTEDYWPPGFRDDLAGYEVMMSYHPWFHGTARRGKFYTFTVRSLLPDNIHEADFGWGVGIPDWFAVSVLGILPVIRVGSRAIFCFIPSRSRRGEFRREMRK